MLLTELSAATRAHFERMRSGRVDTAETSALHLDLLRDMKLINGHIVAAAAYPVLECTGELLPSCIASTARVMARFRRVLLCLF